MPGKGKGRARGKSRGRHISERLEWQISFGFSKRLLAKNTPAELRRQALEYWEEYEEVMPGVKIIGKWRNPNNKNPRHAAWKYSTDSDQSIEGFFTTIRPALRKALARSRGPVPVHHKPAKILPGGVKVVKGKKVKP
jgi:hypothetical protein